MSGFNSFVVEECTAPAQGLLLLRLEFNEITIATRHRYAENGNRYRPREQGQYERSYHADHFDRYRNTRPGRRETRDYGISSVDSFQRRNSDREHYDDHRHYDRDYDRDNDKYYDRDYDRDYDRNPDRDSDGGYDKDYERNIVQAYGVVLEFGYISKAAAESNYDRHLAGVTINLADVELR